MHSAVFRWVPSEYYAKPLQWRRDVLQCPSVQYLCKSIVLENTHCVHSDCSDPNNARYYIVVFQYIERFDSERLMRFIKDKNPTLGKKKFNFRLADPEAARQLTGFGYNAVVPFGGNVSVPVVLSEKLLHLSPKYFWMGGGHVDCKLRVDTDEFLHSAVAPFVADISIPMSEEELNSITD
jgi:prolyl-tRNA editing enzyme YbaK/EbsC (Cys-tRNA(Pro) deacylase)